MSAPMPPGNIMNGFGPGIFYLFFGLLASQIREIDIDMRGGCNDPSECSLLRFLDPRDSVTLGPIWPAGAHGAPLAAPHACVYRSPSRAAQFLRARLPLIPPSASSPLTVAPALPFRRTCSQLPPGSDGLPRQLPVRRQGASHR